MLATNKKYKIVSVQKNTEGKKRKHFIAVQLRYEYWDYTDEYRYCIYTRLPKAVLLSMYGEELKKYEPYIILDWECYKVRMDFVRNDEKFKKRRQRTEGLYGYEDGVTECIHSVLQVSDVMETVSIRIEVHRLAEALNQLTQVQKHRVIAHFIEGKSSRTIAAEEGVNYSKVDNSIKAALKKLRKILG